MTLVGAELIYNVANFPGTPFITDKIRALMSGSREAGDTILLGITWKRIQIQYEQC